MSIMVNGVEIIEKNTAEPAAEQGEARIPLKQPTKRPPANTRERPEPVKIALGVLDTLESVRAEKLRKALPAYAMTLSRQGKEVTAEILLEALAKGEDTVMGPRVAFNRAAAPETIEQRYARIVKDMPKNISESYVVDVPNSSPTMRMYLAAMRGDLAMVQHMIEKGADVRASDDAALCSSAFHGHFSIVKFLVEKGADVRARDSDVLHNAIFYDHYCIAHFLIGKGADIHVLPKRIQKAVKSANTQINRWIKATGDYPPEGLTDKKPGSFEVKSVETIANLIKAERYKTRVANRYAYNALMLFGTLERTMDYFEKWAKPSVQPLHDAVQMISIPDNAPDIKSWADAVMQQGPEMAKLVKFADKIPQPLKSADGKTYSLTKTREAAARFAYPHGHENPELASLFYKFQMNENNFNDALDLVKKCGAKIQDWIPDVTIAGEKFGMPKATFKKLPDSDYRGLVLGQITDCCQSIGGAGEDCAKHGFSSENGGFYVVAVNDNKKDEEIIGQSWAWRGKNDELVLDSLETLGGRVSSKQWTDLTREFSKALGETDITALHVGQGGATPRDLPFETAKNPATPKDYDGYRDSRRQYKITGGQKN